MTVTLQLGRPTPARPDPVPAPRWSATAQLLALAHAIDRATEDGLACRAHLARRLGLSRARLTQVASLVFLAPDIQEQIATGQLDISDHALRRIATLVDWDEQRRALRGRECGSRPVTADRCADG